MLRMKKLFSNLTEKQFKILTIIICMIGDVLISTHIWLKFSDQKLFNTFIDTALNQMTEFNAIQLPSNFRDEFYLVLRKTLVLILVVYIGIQTLIYLTHYFRKEAVHSYIFILCSSAGIGFVLLGLFNLFNAPIYPLFLIQGLAYLLIVWGLKFFKTRSPSL